MSELHLEAQKRELTGRKVRQLRRAGLVPVVVYGQGQEPANLQVNARSLNRILHEGGASQLVRVSVDGAEELNVLVRDLQHHPVSHDITHVDFYAVNMREKQQVSIPIHQVGRVSGLEAGLMVLQAMDQIDIEALPADLPAYVEIDVSGLTQEESITVAQLPALPGVEYLADPDETVFTIVVTRAALEEEEEAVEEEMVEPEVIGRESDEEDLDEE